MRKDFQVPDEHDEMAAMPADRQSSRVVTEFFTPLLARVEKESAEILPALLKLKKLIGDDDFDLYINTLQNIRRNETTVLLITDKALHKTNIEARFMAKIEEAFGVEFVRVVSTG
ncbi:MAG: hypothetical protein LBP78_00285 [Acidaminococcales bacterium]|nr:hypothetical protein [Acidaminococcales bacterium]